MGCCTQAIEEASVMKDEQAALEDYLDRRDENNQTGLKWHVNSDLADFVSAGTGTQHHLPALANQQPHQQV